jgi:hypothetical protein
MRLSAIILVFVMMPCIAFPAPLDYLVGTWEQNPHLPSGFSLHGKPTRPKSSITKNIILFSLSGNNLFVKISNNQNSNDPSITECTISGNLIKFNNLLRPPFQTINGFIYSNGLLITQFDKLSVPNGLVLYNPPYEKQQITTN